MTSKVFECESCGAEGRIIIKGTDLKYEDIVYCPICSADIYEEEDIEENE